jgi:hypothetical protein
MARLSEALRGLSCPTRRSDILRKCDRADDSEYVLLIRINGEASPAVLDDIISAIEPEARSCVWSLLEIEGVARGMVIGRDVLSLEETVNESPTGLTLAWADVKQLADTFTDVGRN